MFFMSCSPAGTFKRHVSPGLQVHLAVSAVPPFLGIVANVAAAVLPAAQADALLEPVGVGALEGKALLVFIHQGVHKEVYRPLVFALHHFGNI